MFTTIDELYLYSFTENKLPLLKLVQQDKVKNIYPIDPIQKKISIELHKDTFKDINFDQFLDDMMTINLDYTIKILGKRIFIFISFPK